MTRWGPYLGWKAAEYENVRAGDEIWAREEAALRQLLEAPAGATVLDVPVGTGRFLELYRERGYRVIGVDLSPDMLAIARRRDPEADLRVGNVLELDLPDQSVDAAVCVRLLYFLTAAELQTALAELRRVARGPIIVTARVGPTYRVPDRGPIVHTRAALGPIDREIIIRQKGWDYVMARLRWTGKRC